MESTDESDPLHRLARWSLRHPRATLLLAALASLVALVGVLRLESRVGYRAFLGERHPEVAALDAHAERFGGGIPLAAVWRCAGSAPCRSVFDPASLRMAHDVARGNRRGRRNTHPHDGRR